MSIGFPSFSREMIAENIRPYLLSKKSSASSISDTVITVSGSKSIEPRTDCSADLL